MTAAELRSALQLSQRSAARLLKVSRSTIQRYETEVPPQHYILTLRLAIALRQADFRAFETILKEPHHAS